MCNEQKGPLRNLRTMQALICAAWSGPSFSTYSMDTVVYVDEQRMSRSDCIGVHAHLDLAYGIRVFFPCCAWRKFILHIPYFPEEDSYLVGQQCRSIPAASNEQLDKALHCLPFGQHTREPSSGNKVISEWYHFWPHFAYVINLQGRHLCQNFLPPFWKGVYFKRKEFTYLQKRGKEV